MKQLTKDAEDIQEQLRNINNNPVAEHLLSKIETIKSELYAMMEKENKIMEEALKDACKRAKIFIANQK